MIGEALGRFVEEVLVQFKGDTSELEAAADRIDRKAAESASRADQNERRRAAAQQSIQNLLNQADLATQRRAILEEQLATAFQNGEAKREAALRLSVATLDQHNRVLQQRIATQREVIVGIDQENQALAVHTRQLQADAVAAREQAAGGGTRGVSGAGAAILGGLSAVGAMVAMQAVVSLGNAVQQTALAYVTWGHDVEHTSKLLGSNAQEASVLLYTFQRFNVDAAGADRVILNLSRHVAENEDKFAKLGVQTRNTNGEFKSAYEIFEQVRQTMSTGADGINKNVAMMELLARAGAGGGTTFAELNAILSLTDDQMAAVKAEAQRLGFVLDDAGAKKAFEMQNQMRGLGQTFKGLQVQISSFALPALDSFITKVTEAIGAVQYLASANGSVFDKIGGYFGVGPLAGGADAAAKAAVAQAKAIGAALDGGQDQVPDVSNAGMGGRSKADDLRDQIKAIQEARDAAHEAAMDELDGYTRNREQRIADLEAVSKAQQASHDATIAQIEAEKRASTDAFDARQRARDDETRGIRDQLSLLEETWREQDARDQLAADKASLTIEQDRTVFRTKGMTEEEYQQKVFEQRARVAAAQKKVSDDTLKIERDAIKAGLDARIKAIDAASLADRRATDDFNKDADARIRSERAIAKAQSDDAAAYVAVLREEIKTEKQRVDDAEKGYARETKARIAEIQKQIDALGSLGAAADYAARPRTLPITVVVSTVNTGGSGADTGGLPTTGAGSHGQIVDPSKNPDGSLNVQTGNVQSGMHNLAQNIVNGVSNSGVAQVVQGITGAISGIGHLTGLIHDYPHSMTLPEPTVLLGASGRSYGVAAKDGPEPISFGGVGGGGGGGGGNQTIQLVVDGKVLSEIVVGRMGRELGRRGAWGYGRKS